MGLRKYLKAKEYSIFNDNGEGEITNIIIAFLVSISLILFPLPIHGLIAVFAWVFFLVVAIKRQYNRYAIVAIGTVVLLISSYQIVAIPDHLEEQSLYEDLIEVDPEQGRNGVYQASYDIDIDVLNDNVDKIYYSVSSTYDYDRENFSEFDYENNDVLTITTDERKGAYYLLLIIELEEGSKSPHEQYGLYYIDPEAD